MLKVRCQRHCSCDSGALIILSCSEFIWNTGWDKETDDSRMKSYKEQASVMCLTCSRKGQFSCKDHIIQVIIIRWLALILWVELTPPGKVENFVGTPMKKIKNSSHTVTKLCTKAYIPTLHLTSVTLMALCVFLRESAFTHLGNSHKPAPNKANCIFCIWVISAANVFRNRLYSFIICSQPIPALLNYLTVTDFCCCCCCFSSFLHAALLLASLSVSRATAGLHEVFANGFWCCCCSSVCSLCLLFCICHTDFYYLLKSLFFQTEEVNLGPHWSN